MTLLIGAVALSGCASRAEEAGHFGYAASAPLRDVNMIKPPIPRRLSTLQDPYGYTEQSGCRAWAGEIRALRAAVNQNQGRRVGFRRDASTFTGRTGNIRDVTVKSAATNWIPFRGVVRQLSGASAFEQKAEFATDRAQYRIGYLIGLGRANRCEGF